jgi:hypothetical protein
MASYKVIQDIEAEDKLVGPLSLRQFVYAGIAAICLYLTFIVITKGLAVAAIIFLPPAAVFGFLAFPWGGEQPTEVWALAKVQFYFKPRKRIWNQSGVKELVTITAPKRVEQVYTNGLSETEVRSRLKALADTIDSRGWVIKNVSGPGYIPGSNYGQPQSNDRLLGVTVAPQATPFGDHPSDDVLDAQNPVAQKFDSLIDASQKAHRQEIINRMNAPEPPAPTQPAAPANNYWFLNQPTQAGTNIPQDAVTFNTQVVAPGMAPTALPVTAAAPTPDEEAFVKQLPPAQPLMANNIGHLHVIQPLGQNGQVPPPQQPAATAPYQPPTGTVPTGTAMTSQGIPIMTEPQVDPSLAASQSDIAAAPVAPSQPVTPTPDAGILDLARNDDLNVATIAREAQKRKDSPDEVVISLH